ncbi:MAG: glycoside hydrolase family 1 protein [Synechococcales cyanobacterium T60_A2020_003]|nr:glycoside hydrolase family 1 protein [Synechococcales cyanobacterium T60_A2020_003]
MQSRTSSSHSAKPSFLWGVATSGYQSEGGYNGDGQPHNNWARCEQYHRVMPTGKAAEFWTRYEDDFQRCRDLGLTAFRLGIEWARVQPSYRMAVSKAPAFDTQALDAYGDRIAACRRYGLEAIVTLHHFTHPGWLPLDAWLHPETVDAFENYVATTVRHINRRLVDVYHMAPIHWYITTNEPNMLITNTYVSSQFPSSSLHGAKAIPHAHSYLIAAHIRAYNQIHDIYQREGWPTPMVSLNTYCSDLYWSEKMIWDILDLPKQDLSESELPDFWESRALEFDTMLNTANLPFRKDLPYRIGRVLHRWANWSGKRLFTPAALQACLQEIDASPRSKLFDFIGLDYYDPFAAHVLRLPSFSDFEFKVKDFRGWLMSGITSKWWDWRCLPEGLYVFCKHYAESYDRPVLIAENGMALRRKPDNSVATTRGDQLRRSEFLEAHLRQVHHLLKDQVPLVGYMHWSLTDNYEWGSYTPRFGLFSLDYAHGTERSAVDHLGDRPAETYRRLIQAINADLGLVSSVR